MGFAERVVRRYHSAKAVEQAAPVKKLVEAIRAFEASGDLDPLESVFATLRAILEPGGRYAGWYQTLAPTKRRDFQTILGNVKAGQKMVEDAKRGIPLPDRFRGALPNFVKMVEKLNVAFAATTEEAVLTHGPWKVHNLSGIDEEGLKGIFAMVDKADALLSGKFGPVLHGTINLGNKASNRHAFASYDQVQDTIQINMKAYGQQGDMLKSFIHELGHRYWFKFCKPQARVVFKTLSKEISVSEYGGTNVLENFAEGFAFFALKWNLHPDMVRFFEAL